MSDTITVPEADNPVALFKSVVAEERWLQGAWFRKGDDGRDYLCLAASFGKPGQINDASQCPTGVLPQWLFQLMPTLDDGVARQDVPWLFKGFAERIDAMVKLDDAAWDRIQTGLLIASVRQAIESATPAIPTPTPDYWPQVTAAADQVIEALQGNGDLAAAEAAARAAAWAAAEAAARAAAWAAAEAAARAAAWAAAEAAARAAAWAAAIRKIAETLFALIDAEINGTALA